MKPVQIGDATLYQGDCLEVMAGLPDGCVDMVLTDPPYGTTACKWDAVIPLEPMWAQLQRLAIERAAIVMTASQPFTSALVMSNVAMFKYDWVWEKTAATGHLNAKKQPMKAHENVLVFYSKQPTYKPQKTTGHARKVSTAYHKRNSKKTENYGPHGLTGYDSTDRYPRSVLLFPSDKQKLASHPTQKPVALMEYLIKTYTNSGDVVLDFTMGSGTTGVACANLKRKFIGIEREPEYFQMAKARILDAYIRGLSC